MERRSNKRASFIAGMLAMIAFAFADAFLHEVDRGDMPPRLERENLPETSRVSNPERISRPRGAPATEPPASRGNEGTAIQPVNSSQVAVAAAVDVMEPTPTAVIPTPASPIPYYDQLIDPSMPVDPAPTAGGGIDKLAPGAQPGSASVEYRRFDQRSDYGGTRRRYTEQGVGVTAQQETRPSAASSCAPPSATPRGRTRSIRSTATASSTSRSAASR